MCKFFYMIILSLLICSGCKDKEYILSTEYIMVMINQTSQEINYQDGNFELESNGSESVTQSLKLYGKSVIGNGGLSSYIEPVPLLLFDYQTLYVLTDTLSYTYYRGDKTEVLKREDRIFLSHYTTTLQSIDSGNNIEKRTLTVDNEILSITKKDYSMLERFPEYYSR